MVRHLSFVLCCLLPMGLMARETPRCLYLNAYHEGYAWSDGIREALYAELEPVCEMREFRLDSKRITDPGRLRLRAAEAAALIAHWHPDIVIASDDNSIHWIVQPYLQDSAIPVVFCGVNWSMEEYGLPYRNTTGMIEVAPIRPLLKQIRRIVLPARHALYIDTDNLTGRKDLARHRQIGQRFGIDIEGRLVETLDDWRDAILEGQKRDFIILGSSSGIRGWEESEARDFLVRHNRKLIVTVYEWIMPLAHFGLVKLAEEQGRWAGLSARAILFEGLQPADIPVIANREWDTWINPSLMAANDIHVPRRLAERAKQVPDP